MAHHRLSDNNKLNILVDTNSLSHMTELDIKPSSGKSKKGKKTFWLWRYFNVYVPSTIQKEFSKNISRIKQPGKKSVVKEMLRNIGKNSLNADLKYTQQIEKTILPYYIESGKIGNAEDEGERHLVCAAIELVYLNKLSSCIILTDDRNALTSFISSIKEDFIFGEIWNVFDLILYLFLTRKEVSESQVEIAIRDLVALTSVSVEKYKQQERTRSDIEARQAMLRAYLLKISRIKLLRDTIPK